MIRNTHMFALIDCNNFYASCERVFNPALLNKPVVVLSNNDGCVIARSNEAKEIGIPMGALAFEYEKLFAEKDIHVFSSNYALYGDMSSRVMSILKEFAPEVEVYSIDEAFLAFEGMLPNFDYDAFGKKIKEKVVTYTGIPVSIGFAPTKTLAKLANKIAKKFATKTNGVYVMDNSEKRIKALKWFPIGDVWGIGASHTKRLKAIQVNKAYDFTQLKTEWVQKYMGVVGLRLYHELQGTSCIEMEDVQNKKNIATTRSFETNYYEYELIHERVVTFAVSCAEKLRSQDSTCKALMLFVHSNGNRKDLAQYSKNAVIQLPYATNSSIELAKFASQLLKQIFVQGIAYKKAGVIVMDIGPACVTQTEMFEQTNPKHELIFKAIDKMHRTIGKDKIKLAAQDLGRTWKMRQERLSPRYTTRFNEIITIKA